MLELIHGHFPVHYHRHLDIDHNSLDEFGLTTVSIKDDDISSAGQHVVNEEFDFSSLHNSLLVY